MQSSPCVKSRPIPEQKALFRAQKVISSSIQCQKFILHNTLYRAASPSIPPPSPSFTLSLPAPKKFFLCALPLLLTTFSVGGCAVASSAPPFPSPASSSPNRKPLLRRWSSKKEEDGEGEALRVLVAVEGALVSLVVESLLPSIQE